MAAARDLFTGPEPLQFFSKSREDRGPLRKLSNFARTDFMFKIEGVFEDFDCIEVPYQLEFARELNLAEFSVSNALRHALRDVRPEDQGLAAKQFMGKGNIVELLWRRHRCFPSKGAAGTFYDSAKRRFHEYNIPLMKQLVYARFTQDEPSKYLLLGTKDRELVHFTRDGGVWGHNVTKGGQNMLGRMLMEVRSYLRSHADVATTDEAED